jgi:Sjoegren syndrome nuclear autoantigen 1
MSNFGADLQATNNELVGIIEGLRERRLDLDRAIQREEEERQRVQADLRILNERVAKLDESLARKYASRQEFDRTIQETQNSFCKILESSKTLLTVVRKDSASLSRKLGPGPTLGSTSGPSALVSTPDPHQQ